MPWLISSVKGTGFDGSLMYSSKPCPRAGAVAESLPPSWKYSATKTQARLSTKIRELTPRSWGQSLKACFEELNEYCRGWIGHFRICTEEGASEFREFDAHLRRRLRAIIIHQKKRARFLYRHLVKRGASPRQAAGTAYSRRGIWHRSNRPGMIKAYPNAWFATQWTSLYDLWWIANPPVEVSDQLQLDF
jgi:RNA-directed DNA polymerase